LFPAGARPADPVTSPLISRPWRTVFVWQTAATCAIALAAGAWAGWNGALSALLGGGVSLAAGIAFAVILALSLGDGRPAGVARPLVAMMKAEAGKLAVIVVGLALVLKTYAGVVHAAFFAAFAIAIVVFAMAILVPEPAERIHG